MRFRILKERALTAQSSRTRHGVSCERHLHIQRCLPELVILWCRVTLAAREALKTYPSESRFFRELQLLYRITETGIRNYRHRDQTVRSVSAVFFHQPTIVRMDHRLIAFILSDTAPKP